MKRGENYKRVKTGRGQVWIETVIYLLIAFVMIGLVLSFIRPKIEEVRDKTIIEQSLELMKEVENIMLTIGSPGNKRLIELNIKKGSLIIDGENDAILFEIESRYVYSEPGQIVKVGNVEALTVDKGEYNLITLKRDFRNSYDITYKNENRLKTLGKASTPYRMYITNKGETMGKINMDFDL